MLSTSYRQRRMSDGFSSTTDKSPVRKQRRLSKFECWKPWECPALGESSSMNVHCFTMKFKLREKTPLRNHRPHKDRDINKIHSPQSEYQRTERSRIALWAWASLTLSEQNNHVVCSWGDYLVYQSLIYCFFLYKNHE